MPIGEPWQKMTTNFFHVCTYKVRCGKAKKTHTFFFFIIIALDAISYEKFMNMVGNTKEKNRDDINHTEMGIMAVPSWDYYDDETVPEYSNPWIKDVVYNVSV